MQSLEEEAKSRQQPWKKPESNETEIRRRNKNNLIKRGELGF